MSALPLYQCHKKVRAAKIAQIKTVDEIHDYRVLIVPEDKKIPAFRVSDAYMDKHKPQVGGYFVVYDGDGYQSFSPAKAFEEGYTLIE